MLVDRVTFQEDRCKACELCVHFCPQKIIALSDRINKLGYHPAAAVDQDKCTSCTLCARICPDTAIEVYKP
jgi:2-oxoglutarate ferredoxin oxidoreductase subunit delta